MANVKIVTDSNSGITQAEAEKLVRMYRRMPAPLKKTVKKIMGMG